MIEFRNVCFKYPTFSLNNINFKIKSGEIIAITGNNASGKTTLIKLIAGITKQKKGEILFNNTPLKKCADLRIGIIFQNPDNQIIFNNVYDDICFTLKNFNINKEEFDSRIDHALSLVGMQDYKHKESFTLSTGQKQRIAIANMLAINPQVIIFDEASVYLDPLAKQSLYVIFQKLKQEGVTVIFTTNFIEEIIYADRVMILKDGEILKFTNTQDIIKNLNCFRELNMPIPLKLELIEKLNLTDYSDLSILKKLKVKWWLHLFYCL